VIVKRFEGKKHIPVLLVAAVLLLTLPVHAQSGPSFANAVAFGSGGYAALSVAVADVNGDGKPDLLVANLCVTSVCSSNGTVGVLLGNGDGTFRTAVTYGSGGYGPSAVAVADVNGDGKPDLLVANQCASSCSGSSPGVGTVGVLLGNGDGTFQPVVTYPSAGYFGHALAVADVNGDGKPDLLVTIQCSSIPCSSNSMVGVLLGNGNGTFQTVMTYGAGGYASQSIAVRDVNGDGKPDLLVANQCASYGNCAQGGGAGVLLGNGNGSFQTAVSYASDGIADSVAVADVNGDGKPDLLVANYCVPTNCPGSANGTVAVLLGNGDGTFRTAVTYGSGGYAQPSVAVADVNGDGKPDLLVASQCANSSCPGNGEVGVLLGKGDGTFQPVVTYGSGGYDASSLAVADVNGDGKPDLLVANQWISSSNSSSGTVGVLINTTPKATTTTTLVSSSNPMFSGVSVTFTATVTPNGATVPTGSVTFNDGATVLGSGTLNGSAGVATLATTSLTSPGTHSITAEYDGDGFNLRSTSSVVTVTVNAATFAFSASPTSQTISNGASASYNLSATPSGSYTSQISFSCTFSPSSSATCAASPVTPDANTATTTLMISGATPAAAVVHTAAADGPRLFPLYGFWMPMGFAGLLLSGVGKRSRVRPLRYLLLLATLLVVDTALLGCGGASAPTSPPSRQPQTYQVTITAMAPATSSGSSEAVTTTQTVSLTVNP
jgi:hypothetical protein